MAHDVLWLRIPSDYHVEIAVHLEDGRHPDGHEARDAGSRNWASPLRRPAHLLLPRWRPELALLLQVLTMQHLAINPYDEPPLDPPQTGLIRSR